MPVAIQGPGKVNSPLDAIANALAVVDKVYGIKANTAALEKAKLEQQAREEEMKRNKSGILSKRDLFEKGSQYEVSNAPGKDTMEFKVDDGNGNVSPIFLKAKKADLSPLLPLQMQNASLEGQNKRLELEANMKKNNPSLMSKEEKLRSLGTDGRARYDNATMALSAVRDMGGALGAGDSTFQLVGDNDFTLARTNFEEALGRMQSGGAIGKEEVSRFKSMAPGMFDSPEIRKKKLAQLELEMGRRLETLGFEPEAPTAFVSTSKKDAKSPLIPEAKATGGGQITAADLEALQWAKGNPNDPRAAGIFQTLKMKGLK